MYIPRFYRFNHEARRKIPKPPPSPQPKKTRLNFANIESKMNGLMPDPVPINLDDIPVTLSYQEMDSKWSQARKDLAPDEHKFQTSQKEKKPESSPLLKDKESHSVLETSKMDLSEIQEENAIQEPVRNLKAADRVVHPLIQRMLTQKLDAEMQSELIFMQQRLMREEE